MAGLIDVCRFRAASAGTGDFLVLSAIVGYQSPSSANAVDGRVYSYRAETEDLTQWEIGQGAYTASSTTIARTTILYSSTGSKINFVSPPQVGVVALAEDLLTAVTQNNLVFNGDMEIDQPNEGASIAIGSASDNFTIDGWHVHPNTSATGLTVQRVADAPQGFRYSLKTTIGTGAGSVAAGDYFAYYQPLDAATVASLGWGQSGSSTWSASFWVKSSITGTFALNAKNVAADRSFIKTFTILAANTWELKTFLAMPNPTSSTWTGDSQTRAAYIQVKFGTGSTYQNAVTDAWITGSYDMLTGSTTSAFLTTTGATVQITGFQLGQGSTIGPYVHRRNELFLAQQWYEKSYNIGVVPGTITDAGSENNNAVTATARFNPRFKVTKIRAPTITTYSPVTGTSAKIADITGSVDISATTAQVGMNSFLAFGTTTADRNLQMHWVADARL